MTTKATMTRVLLVAIASSTAGCIVPNEEHCWVMQGDATCEEIFGGGYCSSDRPSCGNHGAPFGCVFARPIEDACYSPTGDNASCADANPAPQCASNGEESGESETSGGLLNTPPESAVCGNGITEGTEECDDGNAEPFDGCNADCEIQVCGDGIVQLPEACDDGNLEESDDCVMCADAACGDGVVHASDEMCDDGNMIDTDGCKNDCTLTICGDGIEELPEECDDGNLEDQDGCSGTCEWEYRIVFITSQLYVGNLGGIPGADAKCNMLAEAANLSGIYMAWISTNSARDNPASRFNKSTVPYVLVDGIKVADNWTDLTDGTLDQAINRSEMGDETIPVGVTCDVSELLVRTGTAADGTKGDNTCNNFTSGHPAFDGTVGSADFFNNPGWTHCGPAACDIPMPIYCFQQ